MKLKIGGALFRCGRCRKAYSNPFGHVCVTRLDRRAPAGKTKLAPRVTASAGTCPTCHKALGNPLTHTCTVRTDFRRRTAGARKQQAREKRAVNKAATAARRKRERASRPQHRYETCRDQDCERIGCQAFRQGRDEGYRDGYADGWSEGYAAGRSERS